jgi:hypothetical protein
MKPVPPMTRIVMFLDYSAADLALHCRRIATWRATGLSGAGSGCMKRPHRGTARERRSFHRTQL